MTIKDELLAIYERDGILNPKRIVDWARDHKDSALHSSLEWDNTKAGEEYRLQQARYLIRVNIINMDNGVREMISLSIDRTEGGGYRDLGSILENKELTRVMLADALAELDRVERKYNKLTELAPVWKEVEKTRTRLKRSEARRSKARPSHAERSRPSVA